MEVLTRRHRQRSGDGAEEHRLGRAAVRHAPMEPIERLDTSWNPRRALLGQDDPQAGVALEDAAEDEMPHGAMREPRELDQHDRPRGLVVTEVGQAAAAVNVQHDAELFAQVPERLVDRIPQGRDRGVRRHVRQQDAAEHVDVLLPPADLGERVVDVVQEDLREPGTPAGRGAAEVGHPTVVRLQTRPTMVVVERGRLECREVALREEGRHGVREQHLGREPLRLRLLQAPLAVPVAVRGRRLQVGVGIDVGGGPGVELVVPARSEVRLVLVQFGARVTVDGDDGVPARQIPRQIRCWTAHVTLRDGLGGRRYPAAPGSGTATGATTSRACASRRVRSSEIGRALAQR